MAELIVSSAATRLPVLPPELLAPIIEFAVSTRLSQWRDRVNQNQLSLWKLGNGNVTGNKTWDRQERRDLSALALVSRTWTALAQSLLSKHVSVADDAHAESWIESGGCARVKTLAIGAKVSSDKARAILSLCESLEELAMPQGLDVWAELERPAMRRLRSLVIERREGEHDSSPERLFSFQLQTLDFSGRTLDTGLMHSLLSASGSAMQYLNIRTSRVAHADDRPALMDALAQVTPTLRSLSISPPRASTLPTSGALFCRTEVFLEFIPTCTALSHLRVDFIDEPALLLPLVDALPESLEQLHLDLIDYENDLLMDTATWDAVATAILERGAELEKLKVIRLCAYLEGEVSFNGRAWREFKARGGSVRFD